MGVPECWDMGLMGVNRRVASPGDAGSINLRLWEVTCQRLFHNRSGYVLIIGFMFLILALSWFRTGHIQGHAPGS